MSEMLERKKEEYIKVTSLVYHISEDLEAMSSGEKIVINCDPPDVDEEGRLL